MLIKVFTKNKEGKIEFTEEELRKVLNEAYLEGYNSRNNNTITWPSPKWWDEPYYTTTTTTTTLNNDKINKNTPICNNFCKD